MEKQFSVTCGALKTSFPSPERRAAHMADKVENMNWLDLVENFGLKDNGGGLKKALKDYAEAKAKDEYDLALGSLADLAKLGTDLKNSKEAKAAGPAVIKRIGKLLDGAATSRKEWEKKKA